MEDHWFDTLNKALVRERPRRPLLRTAAAAIMSLGLAALPDSGAGKKGKNGKGKDGKKGNKGKQNGRGKDKKKDKKKDKPPPPPDQTCSGGRCRASWPSSSQYDSDNRDYCEFICQQCDGDDTREFCILGHPNVPIAANCCEDGLSCCTDDFGYTTCANLFEDDKHCGACGHRCSPGKVCFGGTCECMAGLTECDGICWDTLRDEGNCGGCGNRCIYRDGTECCNGSCCDGPWERCCDGVCFDVQFNNARCGSCQPCPAGRECCHGRCIDPATHSCCRAAPPGSGICPYPDAACCPFANGTIGCCPGSCCTLSDGTPACCG